MSRAPPAACRHCPLLYFVSIKFQFPLSSRYFLEIMAVLQSATLLLSALLAAFTLATANNSGCKNEKAVFCYLAQWSIYRPGKGKYDLSHFDPKLCTHLVHAFVGMNETTNEVTTIDKWGDYEYQKVGLIAVLNQLKNTNPKLKVLVSVGGWTQGSVRFSNMASSASRRRKFVTSAARYLRKHKLDGIDMAWMAPTTRGGKPSDKQNFVLLLQELAEELKGEGQLLTVYMLGGMRPSEIEKYYDIREVARHVDYINLVTSEYHGAWDQKTGISAPMHSQDHKNVVEVVNFVLSKGAPAHKVLLRYPTFGMIYVMDRVPTNGKYFDVPAREKVSGQWTKQEGYVGFNELCWDATKSSEAENWTNHWDMLSLTPFAVNGRTIVSYDDATSLNEKLNFVLKKCLGGVSLYSLDTDDFKGFCGGGFYPLLRLASKTLLTAEPTIDQSTFNLLNITVMTIEL